MSDWSSLETPFSILWWRTICFSAFRKKKRGRLSRLRASLVKQDTLASVARDMKLGDYLKLGPGELKSGGFRRDSILADTVEALLGAIYQDCGDMAVCAGRIQAWFGSRLDEAGQEAIIKDSKSRLQEYLQGRHLALPVYTVTAVDGEAHNQSFQVRCDVPGLEAPTEGSGLSRRIAEQNAAAQALHLLGISDE
jgi:ribonuclease-3